MQLKTGSLFEFGPFLLDSAEHRLTREGTPVHLTPRAFDLLLFLVQNPGRLLTKDEIMHAVWADSFVEEANLTVVISVVRKALGEKEANFRYIETVPKSGYRFLAPVRTLKIRAPDPGGESSESASIASSRSAVAESAIPPDFPLAHAAEENRTRAGQDRISSTAAHPVTSWSRVVMIVVAVLVPALALAVYLMHLRNRLTVRGSPVQHSLAILPLRNLRQTPADDFLSFALADAVITRLGPVSEVTVRPSSEIEKYKGETIDARKVAADLNVDTVLTGNFIHDGDELRITWQLVEARTEKILDRDMIDVKYDNLLAVQDRVTQEIIQGLALNLSASEAKRLRPNAPVSPLAYEYYLRGVDLVGSHDFPMAIQMLEKSTEIDSNYALTWAWLGQSYNSSASFQFGGRELYEKAKSAFEHALALEPSQMEARIFMANLLIDTGEVEKAVPLLRQVEKVNPNNAGVHWELGYAYRFAGMLNESVAECEQARRIDPAVRANGAVLNSYLYLGEYDKFLASLPDVGDSSFLVFYRGFGEYHQGNWNQAAMDFDRAWQLDHTMYTQIGRALSDSIRHNNGEGLDLLHDLEIRVRQRGVGDPEGTYKIAEAYAVLGDKASALRMLRYSIDHGFFAWPYFNRDPLFRSIRQDSQFDAIVSIARNRYSAFRTEYF
jgi:DNA-binding winged helix-turn-helix (wHTH) protein/TolB-like protein